MDRTTPVGDPLVNMGVATSIGELDQLIRAQGLAHARHLEDHRRWFRNMLAIGLPLVGLVSSALTLGGTALRDSVTSDAKDKAREISHQEAAAARAEHESLRAADQRLIERVSKNETDIALAMQWKIERAREAKPR